MKKWKNTTERYVCFIDIMGFKDRVNRLGHIKVVKEVEEFFNFIDSILKMYRDDVSNEESIKRVFGPTEIRYITFSDSIIITTGSNNKRDLTLLILICKFVFTKSFEMKLPIKGAISKGLFTANFDRNIFMGQPLIDAFNLQEELFYYGVIANREVERDIDKYKDEEKYDSLIFSLPTPMKGYKSQARNVSLLSSDFSKSSIEELYYYVDGKPRLYVDNTIEVFEQMNIISKKAKQKQ